MAIFAKSQFQNLKQVRGLGTTRLLRFVLLGQLISPSRE